MFKRNLSKLLYKIWSTFDDIHHQPGRSLKEKFLFIFLFRVRTIEQIYGKNLAKNIIIYPETIATPEIQNIAITPWHNDLQQNIYKIPDIYTTTLKGVIYCPYYNILLTPDRRIIADSYPLDGNHVFENYFVTKFDWKRLYDKNVEKISGTCTIFRGVSSYSHSLLEQIPRIYLLNQNEYSQIDQIKLLYSPPLSGAEQLFIDKLRPSNVGLNPIDSKKLYYIERLIFPSYLNYHGSFYLPSIYLKKLQEIILPKRPRKKQHRIFISRKKYADTLAKRHILNEDKLFTELEKLGFKKYCLEELNIVEQIDLFYDAEAVIGADGSGLAPLLFAEKINLLLLSASPYIFPHFYFLCKCPDLDHKFFYLYGKELNPYSNFSVEVDKVLEIIFQW